MIDTLRASLAVAVLLAGAVATPAAGADFEVAAPDGRRILLKDDGTWKYLEAADEKTAEKKAEKPEDIGEAVLSLERRTEIGPNCRFELRLVNNLKHEIRNVVPSFSAFRADGVLYESTSIGFFSMRPGNTQNRSIQFHGIACKDIARVQVSGGDRCEIGELDRFSPEKGACLARIRVVPSEIVRFEK